MVPQLDDCVQIYSGKFSMNIVTPLGEPDVTPLGEPDDRRTTGTSFVAIFLAVTFTSSQQSTKLMRGLYLLHLHSGVEVHGPTAGIVNERSLSQVVVATHDVVDIEATGGAPSVGIHPIATRDRVVETV